MAHRRRTKEGLAEREERGARRPVRLSSSRVALMVRCTNSTSILTQFPCHDDSLGYGTEY